MAPPLTLTCLRIDAELLHRGQRDRRERLVDLDDVELVDR